MAGNLQQTIERVNNKAKILVEKYATLLKAKEDADMRIEQLSEQVEQMKKTIETLQSQVEYLRIATTLTPNRRDVEHSRAILSGLVREIDRCIADLTD